MLLIENSKLLLMMLGYPNRAIKLEAQLFTGLNDNCAQSFIAARVYHLLISALAV